VNVYQFGIAQQRGQSRVAAPVESPAAGNRALDNVGPPTLGTADQDWFQGLGQPHLHGHVSPKAFCLVHETRGIERARRFAVAARRRSPRCVGRPRQRAKRPSTALSDTMPCLTDRWEPTRARPTPPINLGVGTSAQCASVNEVKIYTYDDGQDLAQCRKASTADVRVPVRCHVDGRQRNPGPGSRTPRHAHRQRS